MAHGLPAQPASMHQQHQAVPMQPTSTQSVPSLTAAASPIAVQQLPATAAATPGRVVSTAPPAAHAPGRPQHKLPQSASFSLNPFQDLLPGAAAKCSSERRTGSLHAPPPMREASSVPSQDFVSARSNLAPHGTPAHAPAPMALSLAASGATLVGAPPAHRGAPTMPAATGITPSDIDDLAALFMPSAPVPTVPARTNSSSGVPLVSTGAAAAGSTPVAPLPPPLPYASLFGSEPDALPSATAVSTGEGETPLVSLGSGGFGDLPPPPALQRPPPAQLPAGLRCASMPHRLAAQLSGGARRPDASMGRAAAASFNGTGKQVGRTAA